MLVNGLLPLIITCAIVLFLCLVVVVAQNVQLRLKVAFCATCVGLAFWQSIVYVSDKVTTHLLFWNNAVFAGPTLAVFGSYFFIKYLTPTDRNRLRSPILMNRIHILSNYAVAFSTIVQVIGIFSGRIFQDVTYSHGVYTYTRGIFYPIYVVCIIILSSVVIARLIINQRSYPRRSQERQVSNVILVTIVAAIAIGLITNVVIPVLTNNEGVIGLGLISVNLFAGGLAWSIIRHRFLDIHFFVIRAAAYLTTLFVMTFVLVVPVVYAFCYFMHYHPKFGQFASIVFLSVAILYVLQYVRVLFDRFTTRIFFRKYYDPQDVLDKISNVLVRTSDVKELRESTTQILKEAIRPSDFKYALFSDLDESNSVLATDIEKHIRNLSNTSNVFDLEELVRGGSIVPNPDLNIGSIGLAVKLRTTHENLGYMVLGHKQSGETYTDRDRRLLGVAADEIAISMQNALRFLEIQNFNETLQKKIEDATKRLRESNRKLKMLDETKDDFISMASHQLRTPLTSVKGYLSLVLDGDAGAIKDNQRKLLTQAFISSQRMVYLIADLLNVSRLKTGKFIIESTPINLADVVQEEVSQLVETAQSRTLTMAYHKPAHFPVLMLDETKIRQVCMNFMDNAIYYTPAGGHIDVEVKELPKTIEFRVIDNGIGVPKEEQHHLFTKFYRAKNAQRARPDGTGLGLFMAQKVIVAQGGAVIFSSKEGQGSTFGFTFPRDKLQAPATPEPQK